MKSDIDNRVSTLETTVKAALIRESIYGEKIEALELENKHLIEVLKIMKKCIDNFNTLMAINKEINNDD